MRFSDIVPLLNLPRGKDTYTYALPAGADIVGGEFVNIPFRSRTVSGVIWRTHNSIGPQSFTPRPVSWVGRKVLSNSQRVLIERCCSTLGGSRATLSKFWVKQQKNLTVDFQETPQPTNKSYGLSGPTAHIIKEIVNACTHVSSNSQHLLLVPTKEVGESLEQTLRQQLPHAVILTAHANKQPAALLSLIHRLQSTDDSGGIVIATHMGLFLPWQHLTSLWLIDEHHGAHRQWDSEPRIDNRIVAQWLAEYWGATLTLTSVALSISSMERLQTQPQSQWDPNVFSTPLIEHWPVIAERGTEQSDPWSAWMREHLDNGRSVIVMDSGSNSTDRHSWCASCKQMLRCTTCQRGVMAHHDQPNQWYCSWCQNNATITMCPICKGVLFRTPHSTMERLAKKLASVFPEYPVQTTGANKAIPSVWPKEPTIMIIPERTILAATELLRWECSPTPWPPMFVWSLETLHRVGYLQEEQQWQTLLSFIDLVTSKVIYSMGIAEIPSRIHHALTTNHWWQTWYAQERSLRQQFLYPPFAHFILLDTHNALPHNSKDFENTLLAIPKIEIMMKSKAFARRKGYQERFMIVLRYTGDPQTIEQCCRDILSVLPPQWSFTLDPEILPPPLPL